MLKLLYVAMTTGVAVLCMTLNAGDKQGPLDGWTTGRLNQRAAPVIFPVKSEPILEFDLKGDNKFGFYLFENVNAIQSRKRDGLSLNLEGNSGTLGWGRVGDKRPKNKYPSELGRVFCIDMQIELESAKSVEWELVLWGNGYRANYSESLKKRYTVVTQGYGAKRVLFKVAGLNRSFKFDSVDGFELRVHGQAGTRVKIKDIQIYRPFFEGYARKIISIPGKVWRAVADIGKQTDLYINGAKVKISSLSRPRYQWDRRFWDDQVDLTPYFKQGNNCVAIFSSSKNSPDGRQPYTRLKGCVITTKGAKIDLNVSNEWKWSIQEQTGWNTLGFDDSKWRNIISRQHAANAYLGSQYDLKKKLKTYIPAYDGLMLIENPNDHLLYYNDEKVVAFNIVLPGGFPQKNTQIEWTVFQSFPDKQLKKVANGTVNSFKINHNSMTMPVVCGTLPTGVYLLKLQLTVGGTIIENRIPEIFCVLPAIKSKIVAGTTYEQGLDLELEKEIDFTDTDNLHYDTMEIDGRDSTWQSKSFDSDKNPYSKTYDKAIIVEKDGLKYRETRPFQMAQIAYNVRFKHPEDFYLMELTYPDNKARLMGISMTSEMDGFGDHGKLGICVRTGGKFPLTHKERTMKWLFAPNPGWTMISLINLQPKIAAAACSLKMYRVKNDRLPALKAENNAERLIGIVTERGSKYGVWQTFRHALIRRLETIDYYAHMANNLTCEPVMNRLPFFHESIIAAERYTEYLRFTGQNAHFMGCFQYSLLNLSADFRQVDSSRLLLDPRDLLARMFLYNDIKFMANIEFCRTEKLKEIEKTATRSSTLKIVNRDGTLSKNFNFLHPEVEKMMIDSADMVNRKFVGVPNFMGINYLVSVWHGWANMLPGFGCSDYRDKKGFNSPLDSGYGDTTIRRFEKDTGIHLPVKYDDPERFSKRHAILVSNVYRQRWIDWRCDKIYQILKKICDTVKSGNQQLEFIISPMLYPRHAKFASERNSFEDFMNEAGWQREHYRRDDHITLAHWIPANQFYGQLHQFGKNKIWYVPGLKGVWPLGEEISRKPEYFRFYASSRLRPVMLAHDWLEVERVTSLFPRKKNWRRPYQQTMSGQYAEDDAGEPFAQAFIGADPNIVMYGFTDSTLYVGGDQVLRRYAALTRSLPRQQFKPVKNSGQTSSLAIRDYRNKNAYYFYAVNPAFWNAKGTIILRSRHPVENLMTGERFVSQNGLVRIPCKLKPFSGLSFKTLDNGATINDFNGVPEQPEFVINYLNALTLAFKAAVNVPKIISSDKKYLTELLVGIDAAMATKSYTLAWYLLTTPKARVIERSIKKSNAIEAYRTQRAESIAQKELVAKHVVTAPVIDGKLTDEAWKSAVAVGEFVSRDKQAAIVDTEVKAVRDGESIYLGFRCRDNFPGKIKKSATSEKNLMSVGDDFIALFIQPNPKNYNHYFQMAFNTAGVKFDQEVTYDYTIKRKRRDYDYQPNWDVKSTVTADGWEAEVRFPAAIFGSTLEPGKRWKINIHRFFRDVDCDVPRSSWQHTPKSLHAPSYFGVLSME